MITLPSDLILLWYIQLRKKGRVSALVCCLYTKSNFDFFIIQAGFELTDKLTSYLNKNILMYKNKLFVYVVWFVVDLGIF